jgi:hypothetical protein
MSHSNSNFNYRNIFRNNNSETNRASVNNSFSEILLTFYINLYNVTLDRIDALYQVLDETREYINALSGRNRNTQHENQNNNFSQGHRNSGRTNSGRTNSGRTNRRTPRGYNSQRTNENDMFNLFDNRHVYIGGRPYRIEFDRVNIPSTFYNYVPENNHANNSFDNSILNILQSFYSNVPVVASREQINRSTRLLPFSQLIHPLNTSCPITLEPFTNTSNVTEIISCGHLFNPEALSSWFESNVRCPVCRYDIRNHNTTPVTTQVNTPDTTQPENISATPQPDNERSNIDSSERTTERNTPFTFQNLSIDGSQNEIFNSALTDLTESILGQLFNTRNNNSQNNGNSNRLFFNNRRFDPSNNEIVFTGFRY